MILAGENCAIFPKNPCLDQKCFSGTNHQIPIWDHFGLLHPFNFVFLLCINDQFPAISLVFRLVFQLTG